MQDYVKSLQEMKWKALTSVTNDGNQLRQTSLPPRKGGLHSCIVSNPVQCEVPEYHQRGGETTYK